MNNEKNEPNYELQRLLTYSRDFEHILFKLASEDNCWSCYYARIAKLRDDILFFMKEMVDMDCLRKSQYEVLKRHFFG